MGQSGAPVGTAFVEILPKTEGFVQQLSGQLKAAITQAAGGVDASPLTQGLNTGLIALGGAAIAGIYKGIKATQDWATEIITLQRVTGQTTEEASKLAATADAMGVSVTSLTGAFTILGSKVATNNAAFDKYGIATRDAEGNTLPLSDILTEVQAKYQSLPEGIDRTSFATSIFGRTGRQLLPILGLTTDQMAEMGQKAEDLGLVLNDQDVAAAKNLKIAQAELGDAFKGLSIQIGKVFLPILTAMTKGMTVAVELFAKIPVPIKVATLAFLGLNTALVAGRAAWGLLVKNFEFIASGLQSAADAMGVSTAATDENTASTLENAAAQDASNTQQLGIVESYNQAADAVNTSSAATAVNTEATGANAAATSVMAGQTQLAGMAFGELAGEEVAATGMTEVLTGALTGLWTSLNAIKINLAGFMVPLGWAALIIGAVVAVTVIIVKNWDTIKRVTAEVWGGIVKAVQPVIAAIKQAGTELGKALGPVLKDVGQGFKDTWDAISTAVQQAAAAIGPAISEIASGIGEIIKALGPLGPAIAKFLVIGAMVVLFGPFIIALKLLAAALQVVAGWIKLFGDEVAFVFGYISTFVIGTINFFVDAINLLIDAWNKLPFTKTIAPLNEVGQATADVGDSANAAADGVNNLGSAMDSTAPAALDLTQKLSDLSDAQLTSVIDAISKSLDRLGGAFRQVKDLTGVDLSSIKQNLQKYLADPTTATLGDVKDAIQQVRDGYNSWVHDMAQNYGSLGTALDKFSGKHNIDITKMTGALNDYAGQLKQFGNGINQIYNTWGHRAQTLIAYFNSQGIGALGEVKSFNSATKKQQQNMLDATKNVKSQAQLTADAIGQSLKSAFDKIERDFEIMWNKVLRALGKKPAFDINTGPAEAKVANLKESLLNLPTSTVFNIKGTYTPPPNQPGKGGGNAAGGIITGATGFIATSPTYLVGEGHYPTPAGSGAEAIIPLNKRGADFVKKAWGGTEMKQTVIMPRATDLTGDLHVTDWRNGVATLDSEIGWEEAVRTR